MALCLGGVVVGARLAMRAGRAAVLAWALGLGVSWMAIDVMRALQAWAGTLAMTAWLIYWPVLVLACVVPVRRVVRRLA
jgi:hypothetical protein